MDRFEQADGATEVAIDAGKVPTTHGCRDVKLVVFVKSPVCEPAGVVDWYSRDLPGPTARTVLAAVEGCEAFTNPVQVEADRLAVTHAADVTVLGDGAEWIWNLAEQVLPQAGGVLDIYHGMGRLGEAAHAIWGDQTAATAQHREAAWAALRSGGKPGLEEWVGAAFAAVPQSVSAEPLVAAAAYFAKHPARLDCAGRSASGRSIGSGLVEGSIKQLVNLRLKRTGAWWDADHVGSS